MCVLHHVLQRHKVGDDAFGDKKFQKQNLERIDEAVRDICMGYGLAAVQLYKKSKFYPTDDELADHIQRFGKHNHLLLETYKLWLTDACEGQKFAYQSQA